MKCPLFFVLLALTSASAAHGQSVASATLLINIPAGDTQKVVLSGWRHCDMNNTCTTGGNQQVFRFTGGNAYDKSGNIFAPVIGSRNGISAATSLSLLHVNGSSTKFADVPQYKCTPLSSTSILWDTQDLWAPGFSGGGPSFNLVANTLQIVTIHTVTTITATDTSSVVKCVGSSGATWQGDSVVFGASDTTNAYVTVTGPVL